MRQGKSLILFYFKSTFIIITLIFTLFLSNSCDFGPKKYEEIIKVNAREYSLEPAIIFAVAEVESHFNPQAKSKKGAIGIMQIMPETGAWIATSLGIEGYQDSDLQDAEINIRFGTWYLSYLLSRFEESWQGLAAYNAGEGKVRGWIEEGVDSIDMIPLSETLSYVKKVEAAISRYRRKKYAAFD